MFIQGFIIGIVSLPLVLLIIGAFLPAPSLEEDLGH